jgi:UDP-N-acetyl-2-amino-2-deoxyglucuronate dehydrogenase|tara:strand:+ start:1410 stop:2252 length:843 start_codon:yes stop_codon:yes gene_type:complete
MNFALIGAAGYIAPVHMKAIKDTGNTLTSAVDPHDSVGILDSHFPEAQFFTEIERFDRHLERFGNTHYVSICSPNYLHDAHIRMTLRAGAHAICEKPLVINPWNLDALEEFEDKYSHRIYPILQMRYHPGARRLPSKAKRRRQVLVEYVTPRGAWYHHSWKGDESKSGGLLMNIGVHIFDLLIWAYGRILDYDIIRADKCSVSGILEMEFADVEWRLAIEGTARRFIDINSSTHINLAAPIKKSLHLEAYREILAGNGLSIADARPAIEAVYNVKRLVSA